MFRLLSKRTNLFSVPTYIGALLLFILVSNDLEVKFSNIFSIFTAFVGLAMGYVLFNKITFLLKIFQLLKRILIGEKIYFSFLLGFALEIFILVTFRLEIYQNF